MAEHRRWFLKAAQPLWEKYRAGCGNSSQGARHMKGLLLAGSLALLVSGLSTAWWFGGNKELGHCMAVEIKYEIAKYNDWLNRR